MQEQGTTFDSRYNQPDVSDNYKKVLEVLKGTKLDTSYQKVIKETEVVNPDGSYTTTRTTLRCAIKDGKKIYYIHETTIPNGVVRKMQEKFLIPNNTELASLLAG